MHPFEHADVQGGGAGNDAVDVTAERMAKVIPNNNALFVRLIPACKDYRATNEGYLQLVQLRNLILPPCAFWTVTTEASVLLPHHL
jgi:hypothetical protein